MALQDTCEWGNPAAEKLLDPLACLQLPQQYCCSHLLHHPPETSVQEEALFHPHSREQTCLSLSPFAQLGQRCWINEVLFTHCCFWELNEQADGLGNKWKDKRQAANQTPVLLAEQQGAIQNHTGLLLSGEASSRRGTGKLQLNTAGCSNLSTLLPTCR